MKSLRNARGFTLIELLVTIALIVVLAAISFVGYSKYLKSAEKGREVHAARALMAGFHAYSADNGGRIIKAMDPKPGKIVDNKGKPIMSQAAKRWAWRLAPYIDYNTNILLVNNSKAAPADDPMFSYLLSLYTTLGMNGTYVGGKYGTPMSPDNPKSKIKCVTNITQALNPSKLIVFASAKMEGAPHPGCFDVAGPGGGATGVVDYKYNNNAVVAYFDGHVELNTPNQLEDIERWSN
jgi:prepilin-type N-terminal cleavage/methylation domain-containing protein/prepilin-type processing-associated H-X9-DG protein